MNISVDINFPSFKSIIKTELSYSGGKMIQSIRLKNFQSHKDTYIKFHSGVNSIIGSSDNGKTAILRGLYWCRNNRPLGNGIISHWNQDKNGMPLKSTSVEIMTKEVSVIRKREKDFNGYEIGDWKLEAVRTEVPEEVSKIFNMESVNIQRQMDPPFLLSESAGEVAKFFNAIIRLDIIDEVLSEAEILRKSLNRELNQKEEEKRKKDSEIEKLDWVEEAEILIEKIRSVEEKLTTLEAIKADLYQSLKRYQEMENKKKRYQSLDAIENLLHQIQEKEKVLSDQKEKKDSLKFEINSYQSNQTRIRKIMNTERAEKTFSSLESTAQKLKERKILKDSLYSSMKIFREKIQTIEDQNKIIQVNENLLPDVCPLCGGSMKRGTK